MGPNWAERPKIVVVLIKLNKRTESRSRKQAAVISVRIGPAQLIKIAVRDKRVSRYYDAM
ncbi:hypothetical protein COLO4_02888 [Corchorus olitorius]|uniref:Uncharacterized protein n=1 Tax=Corchorus olitorius TaxID=93759 RepID=A0A1R3L045_9ROSI|nr:hypothetical protein COLO4_02888 [Corchorus olitorius]